MFRVSGITVFVLVFLLLQSASWASAGNVDHIIGSQKISVVPDRFLRGYDPVTIFFPGAAGPKTPGPLDQPGDLFQMEPAHPGEYRWLDKKTLQFIPTIPWPALERYNLTVKNKRFELVTMMSVPESISPGAGSKSLDPFSEILLKFSGRMKPDRLKSMISFEIKPLPGLSTEKGYILSPSDFSVKEIERTGQNEPSQYQLTLNKEVGFGNKLVMNFRLSLDDSHPGTFTSYEFTVKPEFRVSGIGAGSVLYPVAVKGSVYSKDQAIDCGTSKNSLFVSFTDRPGKITLSQIKQFVRFEPAVEDFKFSISGRKLRLSFECEREKRYKISLNPTALIDTNGRTLNHFGETSAYFFFRKQQSYVKWHKDQGIIELYGPQHFPMEGVGEDNIDIRIYKIDPLSRNFWPFPAGGLRLNEETRPAGPGEEPSYTYNMEEQVRQLGSPLLSKIIKLPMKEKGDRRSFDLNLKPLFSKISGKNRPGTYLVGYRLLGNKATRSYIRVQVTDLCLTTIEEEDGVSFVVTSLRDGAPVKGAKIVVEDRDKIKGGKKVRAVNLSGFTDAGGMFSYKHNKRKRKDVARIVVTKGADTLVLNPYDPPPEFHDNHWYGSYNNWLEWLESKPVKSKADLIAKAHIFTERPVYKPEESVHIKGYLKYWKEGRLTDQSSGFDQLVINGPGGKSWKYNVTFNEFGSFYHKFLESDLPTGEYTAYLYNQSESQSVGNVSFRKESYRIPRFETRLSGPHSVPLDSPFKITLTADYYAGGRVVGQEVRWNITEFSHTSTMPDYPGFLFSNDQRFSSKKIPNVYGSSEKQETTDDNGSAIIDIDPSQARDGRARRYVVECMVRGADEQTVSSTKQVVALPPFVLGLKLKRFLKNSYAINPEIIAVGHDGKILSGQEITVKLMQRQWHSYLQQSDFTTGEAKYITDVVDNLVLEKTITSTDKPLKLDLNVDKAGVYIVELSGRDKLGRLQKVFADLYVSGSDPVTWEKPKNNVFETVWDKASYNPGDKATLLLKSPHQNAKALVVVEKPDANEYHWVNVKGGKGEFSIDVLPEMTPKIAIHTVLMRGRIKGKGSSGTSAILKPVTMASTSWLRVRPKGYRLNVKLEHRKSNLPGSRMPVKIKLADPDGKPMNGEVTLWLVDRAVLALGREKNPDPVPSFIHNGRSWIRIRDTRNDTVGELLTEEHPGGDGAYDEEAESMFDKITVRRNFKTVPYYNPGIIVRNGEAEVTIDLPDNLTDFAVRAVVTGENRFGFAKSKISIRLPLIVQSALPRFVRPGDEFTAGGIGRVVEGKNAPGISEIHVEGAELKGESKRKIDWVKGVPEKLYFPMKVTEKAAEEGQPGNHVKVKLGVTRLSDKASDGFEISLPVKTDRKREYREIITRLIDGKAVELPKADEAQREGTVSSTVILSSEPALVKMLAGLNYLAAYPHGCTEQRISKLISELNLKSILAKIGKQERTAHLDRDMEVIFKYLESTLTPSGLYSFWPGSEGSVGLTAYAVEFLTLASNEGYQFNPSLLSRGILALKESLRSDYTKNISGHEYLERAEAMYALSLADEFDEAYAEELAARAGNLDLYSEAKLLCTMEIENLGGEKAAGRIKEDLIKSLNFRLYEGEEIFEGLKYRTSSWGGPILSSEVKTIAGVAKALYKSSPDDKRVRLLLDELVSLGAGDGWGSTNANAAALSVLGDVLKEVDPFGQGTSVKITSGGKEESLDLSGRNLITWNSISAGGTLTQVSDTANQNSLAWMRLSYMPEAGGDKVKRKNSGFVVDEELLLYVQKDAPARKYKIEAGSEITFDMGSIVENHITVINPEERFYVAVQVPLAAGFEPMNPNLATAPKEASPEGKLTLQPSYSLYEDDKVTFYYDQLPKGTFDFYFRTKASIEGSFVKPPAFAELMYQQSVFGRANGARIVVKPRIDE